MNSKKLSVRLALLVGLSSVALFGATTGALAWYAYSRSVQFSFVGTTVTKSSLLNVGLVDTYESFQPSELEEFELTKEIHDGKIIYFSKSKSGISLKAIQTYLFNHDYAVSQLSPVTTMARSLSAQTDLDLYKSPEYSETVLDTPAQSNDYSKIPFAFKIIGDDATYVEGKSVWLTEAVCEAQRNIQDAVRVYVEGTSQNFMFRPVAQSAGTGETSVGGLLDLDSDGYYDYNKSTYEEFLYGNFTEAPDISSTGYPDDPEHDVLDDINGTGAIEASTFLAKHMPSVSYYSDFTTKSPQKAEYYNFGQVKPSIKPTGEYYVGDTGIPICSTNSGSKIGYATFTIFVEGWDHSVIDTAAGYSFNLGLRFEIDRD